MYQMFSGPIWLLCEYAEYGNLRDFLRARRPREFESSSADGRGATAAQGADADTQTLTHKDLVSFAFQIARGMEYLSGLKVGRSKNLNIKNC